LAQLLQKPAPWQETDETTAARDTVLVAEFLDRFEAIRQQPGYMMMTFGMAASIYNTLRNDGH
jgi:hypothetical protein